MESFKIKPEIYFGSGAVAALARYAQQKVFIVADPFVVKSGMLSLVTGQLKSCDIEVFDEIVPDPPLEVIAKGIIAFENFLPSVIVAVGGGSAIDAAKAIRYFSKTGGSCGLAAIPTTSGTGSEMTSFTVLTDKKTGQKYPVVSDALLPEMSVLDTEFVKSVPKSVAADTGMDVLTHAIEAYVSTKASAFTDAYAEKAVAYVFSYLEAACGGDMFAKEKMHEASAMAGIAFNMASLGANHAIAHNLGARLRLPHGRVNAILLPYVIAFNAGLWGGRRTDSLKRYAVLGRIALESGKNTGAWHASDEDSVRDLIAGIRQLMTRLDMPVSFRACGIDMDFIKSIECEAAKGALSDGCMATNPRKADEGQLMEIIEKSSEGRLWQQRHF